MVGMGIGLGIGLNSGRGKAPTVQDQQPLALSILLQTELLSIRDRSNEGAIVQAIAIPWIALYEALKSNPKLIFEFSNSPDKFEEFIAASYQREGWDRVVLTPRSGDGGRDVIAEKGGFGAIRILDQCKAFSAGHLVNQNDVRAMLGVLHSDNNASKAVISTSSDFAPSIRTDPDFTKYMPNRLELRNGANVMEWLSTIRSKDI